MTGTAQSSGPAAVHNFEYHTMLLMASGIQMAGPNLTPAAFERGLQKAVFPNPDHPNHPGKVDLRSGRYAMTTDATEWWWSDKDQHPYGDNATLGTPCYPDPAARYRRGQWPAGDDSQFFSPPCKSTP